jgi:hypothetical protein
MRNNFGNEAGTLEERAIVGALGKVPDRLDSDLYCRWFADGAFCSHFWGIHGIIKVRAAFHPDWNIAFLYDVPNGGWNTF